MSLRLKLITLTALIFLGGCVTGTRTIELTPPTHDGEKKASRAIYIGDISDKRIFEAKPASPSTPSVKGDLAKVPKEKLNTLIGRQRNAYGKAMGDVALIEGNTVQKEMRDLLVLGLEGRGYTVSDDQNTPLKMDVDIDQFWAWFTPGMWAVSFEAKLDSKIHLSEDGVNKEISVEGYGLNKAQVASDANWALAYQRAFSDFLKNLEKSLDEAGL